MTQSAEKFIAKQDQIAKMLSGDATRDRIIERLETETIKEMKEK